MFYNVKGERLKIVTIFSAVKIRVQMKARRVYFKMIYGGSARMVRRHFLYIITYVSL